MSKEPQDDEPRGRVEIIPPGEEEDRDSPFFAAHGSHTIRIIKLGPFGSLLLMAAVGLLMVLGLMFFASAMLIILPVAALLAAGAWFSGLLGGNPFKKLR